MKKAERLKLIDCLMRRIGTASDEERLAKERDRAAGLEGRSRKYDYERNQANRALLIELLEKGDNLEAAIRAEVEYLTVEV